MTFVKTEKYAPRVTLHGTELGLNDNGGQGDVYIVGEKLRGLRVSGLAKVTNLNSSNPISISTPGTVLGADYKIGNPIRHIDLFDDFLGAALLPIWNAVHGTDGAAAVAIHADQVGGAVRLTSGANATHTPAANGAELVGDRNFLVGNSGIMVEHRLGFASSVASQSTFFGFTDSDALAAPFTLAAGVVTANCANGAGFLQDAAGTNTNLNAVAVNAAGAPQVVALPQSIDTAAYHIYRTEITASGNVLFFIDYLQVAQINLGVAPAGQLAPTVSMFSEATGASQTLDVDYCLAQGLRL